MKFFILVYCSLFSFSVWSQTARRADAEKSIERIIEVSTDEKSPALAKKELTDRATQQASEDVIKEIIGEAKFSRNRTLIQNKIIRNSARYIPIAKPGELVQKDNKYFLTLNLKINQDDLQSMLLENGLFYESDSMPILLPIIRIIDKVNGRSWGWWQNQDLNKSDLMKFSRSIENSLKSAFLKNNFYVIRPLFLRYAEMLPADIRDGRIFSVDLRDNDWQGFAAQWNAQVLVDGEITISKSSLRSEAFVLGIRVEASQVQNERVIAEVTRQYETDPGHMELVVDQKLREVLESVTQDLAAQVLEAWQKGTIGASLLRLTINGRVPPQMQDQIKDAFRQNVREIKNIRERLISSNQYVLEFDASITPKQLVAKLPKLEVHGMILKADSSRDKEAIYDISRK